MCKSLAYLLLYFVYFMSMLLRSCCCKFKIALDKHNGDYLHRLFLLLSGEVGIQKNLHKYIILGLCGILRFSLLLFPFQTNPFSSFSVETITEIVFTHLYTYPQFSNSQFQCFPGPALTEVLYVQFLVCSVFVSEQLNRRLFSFQFTQ